MSDGERVRRYHGPWRQCCLCHERGQVVMGGRVVCWGHYNEQVTQK